MVYQRLNLHLTKEAIELCQEPVQTVPPSSVPKQGWAAVSWDFAATAMALAQSKFCEFSHAKCFFSSISSAKVYHFGYILGVKIISA